MSRLRIVVPVLVSLLIVSGCSELVPQTEPPTASAQPILSKSATTIDRGICLDPSTSAGSIAAQVRDQTTHTLQDWAPGQIDPAVGQQVIPGLNLTIRLVSTDPYSSEALSRTVRIPGVDALPARPDLSGDGAMSVDGPYMKWKRLQTHVDHQAALARSAAHRGAKTVATMPLPPQLSGITGCLAALREISPHADLLLASDLDENRPPVAIRSLQGRRVLIVLACPDGDAAACRSRAEGFTAWLRKAGAAVDVVRPEAAGTAVQRFLQH